MKRAEAKALAKKYGMRILRAPVTGEAWALYLETPECIDELDDLANQDILPCCRCPWFYDCDAMEDDYC